MSKMLGILGGMGPLASAEFVSSIYEFNTEGREQDSPACVLYSDPTIPDRTEAILNGHEEIVASRLAGSLERLSWLGCSRLVIACVTMHYFLRHVTAPLREKVICLLDLIVDEVRATESRQLMICTSGARSAQVFSRHPRWKEIEHLVIFPGEEDQARIHNTIYTQIKSNSFNAQSVDFFHGLKSSYGAHGLIAGCTELHLVSRHLRRTSQSHQLPIVDPLLTFARNCRRIINA